MNNPVTLAIRGNKEMAELIQELEKAAFEREDLAFECADITFFLLQIAQCLKFDLFEWAGDFSKEHGLASQFTPGRLAADSNVQFAKVLQLLQTAPNKTGEIRTEMASITFNLGLVCLLLGFDLKEMVRRKLIINQARTWEMAEDGSHQHVG